MEANQVISPSLPKIPPVEPPVYILPQNKLRALAPKFITFLVLGVIFYLGVWLNLSLMELTSSTENLIQTISLILLLFIIILGIYLAIHRANQPYKFYRNRLWIHKKELYYINIIIIVTKRDLWDKLFKTYSIALGNQFYLRHISNNIQISDYLQQLVDYAKREQSNSRF
ncbi:MAG TPA: hypothetical protein VJA23_03470 [Candidatus Nanoarchaeia archaeon]|nr:hypothetical protein [Candidatus Nanoarchaeia archaeon]